MSAAVEQVLACGRAANDLAPDWERIRELLAEWDQVQERIRLCTDDPRHYADLYEDDPTTIGSLVAYSEQRCAELDADAAQILADARVHAEKIAAGAP